METFHGQIDTPPRPFDQPQRFGWIVATSADEQPAHHDAGAPLETERTADEDRSLLARNLDKVRRGSGLDLVEASQIKGWKAGSARERPAWALKFAGNVDHRGKTVGLVATRKTAKMDTISDRHRCRHFAGPEPNVDDSAEPVGRQ